MKDQARVVVVGGGVAGLSTLYHLAQEGWTDTVLLERNELASGTTWHSAAQAPSLAFNQLLLLMRKYTIELYQDLAADPDHPITYHHGVGGLRLLTSREQIDGCHHIMSVARGVGLDFELLDADETLRRHPLLAGDDILASLWDPLDGDIDPSQLCQALGRRCRAAGAEIHRNTPVTGLQQLPSGEWRVSTAHGEIIAEHVVVAAGYRANEVGALMGVGYPVVSMEHMYFVTEPIPELVEASRRLPMVRCPRDKFYMRQEQDGLLIGVYEQDCRTFGMDGIDPGFVNALCPPDIERCLPEIEALFERLPVLAEVGIASVVNGPIAYAADANPLVGRQPGLRNCWSMNGIRVGIGEGGGYGKMLAQMIVHGESEYDTWQFDPRRITSFAGLEFTAAKSIEDYRHEFVWHLPHEHRPAGRPAKTSALYPILRDGGAEFGVINGWERTLFYKPVPEFDVELSWRFPNWHSVVAQEVASLQQTVGLAELSGFNRLRITGTDPLGWLDALTCSPVPATPGKVGLCYFLTENGNIAMEATVVQLDDGSVWFGSAAAAQDHDHDWLTDHLPVGADLRLASLTDTHTTLVIAGPRTRDLLAVLAPRTDWSQGATPWLTAFRCSVGHVDVVAMAVSYSGEQAVELHVPNAQLHAVFQVLIEAGREFGLGLFGNHAIESMRLEKGYCHWKAELITEFNPIEAGLDRFVDLGKSFRGKDGLQRQIKAGNRRELAMLRIEGDRAPAHEGETVFFAGRPVGVVTSGAWGYRVDQNLAFAYLEPSAAGIGTELEVLLIGEPTPATVVQRCSYDPENHLPRGLEATP